MRSDLKNIIGDWTQEMKQRGPFWYVRTTKGTAFFSIEGGNLVYMAGGDVKRFPIKKREESTFWVADQEFRIGFDRLTAFWNSQLVIHARKLELGKAGGLDEPQ